MSKSRNTAPEEQPQLGGSYLREKDGSLNRVEGPDVPEPPAAAEEQAPAPAPSAPADDSQEG